MCLHLAYVTITVIASNTIWLQMTEFHSSWLKSIPISSFMAEEYPISACIMFSLSIYFAGYITATVSDGVPQEYSYL